MQLSSSGYPNTINQLKLLVSASSIYYVVLFHWSKWLHGSQDNGINAITLHEKYLNLINVMEEKYMKNTIWRKNSLINSLSVELIFWQCHKAFLHYYSI